MNLEIKTPEGKYIPATFQPEYREMFLEIRKAYPHLKSPSAIAKHAVMKLHVEARAEIERKAKIKQMGAVRHGQATLLHNNQGSAFSWLLGEFAGVDV